MIKKVDTAIIKVKTRNGFNAFEAVMREIFSPSIMRVIKIKLNAGIEETAAVRHIMVETNSLVCGNVFLKVIFFSLYNFGNSLGGIVCT